MQLWCAVPMPEKFIVQLSGVVIRQAGTAQNMFMLRSLLKGWVTFGEYFRGKGASPFCVVWKYPQCIILFCHNTYIWWINRQMDRTATAIPCIALRAAVW